MMKSFIKKYKFYMIILVLVALIMIYEFLVEDNFFHLVFSYFTEDNFIASYNENLSIGEKAITNLSDLIINKLFYDPYLEFDYTIIFGTRIFQILIPFLAVLSGIRYYKKFYTLEKYMFYRVKNIKKYIIKSFIKKSFFMSTSIFMGFVLFYFLILILSKGKLMEDMTSSLFVDIFGKSFYNDHTYLYYMLEGFVRFFIVPFVLSFLSLTTVLIFKRRKTIFMVMPLCYFGLAIFSFILSNYFWNIHMYFSPSSIMASGSFIDVNTYLLFMPYVFFMIISMLGMNYYVQHYEI